MQRPQRYNRLQGATSTSTLPSNIPTGVATAATSTGAAANSTAVVGQNSTPAIVAAASAFLATLDDSQRAAVNLAYPTGETTATAANIGGRLGEKFGEAIWSNYPTSDVIRPGLMMGDLSDT